MGKPPISDYPYDQDKKDKEGRSANPPKFLHPAFILPLSLVLRRIVEMLTLRLWSAKKHLTPSGKQVKKPAGIITRFFSFVE